MTALVVKNPTLSWPLTVHWNETQTKVSRLKKSAGVTLFPLYLLRLTVGFTAVVHEARAVALQRCVDDLRRHNKELRDFSKQLFLLDNETFDANWPRCFWEPWSSSVCFCCERILSLSSWILCGPTLRRSIPAQKCFWEKDKNRSFLEEEDTCVFCLLLIYLPIFWGRIRWCVCRVCDWCFKATSRVVYGGTTFRRRTAGPPRKFWVWSVKGRDVSIVVQLYTGHA